MKLVCKGEYHHSPAGLHFNAGVIEVDDAKGEYLLRDAPENFALYMPPSMEAVTITRADGIDDDEASAASDVLNQRREEKEAASKSFDAAPHDKMVREPKKKK